MTLDYTEGGTIKASMIYYIDEIIAALDKADPRGRGNDTKAAPEDLYKVDEDYEKLSPDKAKMFHDLVTNILYTTKWACPDTCTLVYFLTTRVKEPNKYEWLKIVQIMNYIRGTRDIPLILGANVSGVLK